MIRAVVHFNRTNVRVRVRVEGAMNLTPLSAILQFVNLQNFYFM
jgi:predicted nuclease with TOPRIM domain